MTAVVPAGSIRIPGSRTLRFEGRHHGSGVLRMICIHASATMVQQMRDEVSAEAATAHENQESR
jgi:hypothetical protein